MAYTNLCSCCGTMFSATDWDFCPKCGGDSSNIIIGTFQQAYFESERERNAYICDHVTPMDLRKAISYCYPHLPEEEKDKIYQQLAR